MHTKKPPANRLTDSQIYQVVKAIEEDRDNYQKLNYGEAARKLTKKVGFRVKGSNLRTIADQFDFKFNPMSGSNGTNPVVEAHARCAFLERRVTELEKERDGFVARVARLEALAGVAKLTNA
jgi:hypothetical protein